MERSDDNLNESDFDKVNYMTTLFIEEVLKPLIKNYKTTSISSWGMPFESANLTISPFGKALENTQFYYSENTQFVHFTPHFNANNIVANGYINLSGLNTTSDENEIVLNFKAFEKLTNSLHLSHDLKQNFLSLSLSPFKDDNYFLKENYNSLRYNQMIFGKDFPIGLVFDICRENQSLWYKYHLSKVHYSEEDRLPPDFFKTLAERTIKWNKENCFQITELQNAIFPLLGLFKEPKYRIENEVRLLKSPIDIWDKNEENIPLLNGVSINSKNEIVRIERLYFEGLRKQQVVELLFKNEIVKNNHYSKSPKLKLTHLLLPSFVVEKELYKIMDAYKVMVDKLEIDCKIKILDFDRKNQEVHLI